MKRPAISRLSFVFAVAVFMLALAACGTKPDDTQGAGATDAPVSSPSTSPSVEPSPAGTPTPEMKTETVNVYFTDDDLMDLNEQKADIQYEDESGKIAAAFKALQQEQGDLISLWKGIELLSAKNDSGAVTIDVHIPDDARLGAPGEELAIESISKTMFQFDDVDSLDILVDGEQADSLMGHVDLDHPIKRP